MITIKTGFEKGRKKRKNDFKYLCAMDEIQRSLQSSENIGRVEFDPNTVNLGQSHSEKIRYSDYQHADNDPNENIMPNIVDEDTYNNQVTYDNTYDSLTNSQHNNSAPFAPHIMRDYDRAQMIDVKLKPHRHQQFRTNYKYTDNQNRSHRNARPRRGGRTNRPIGSFGRIGSIRPIDTNGRSNLIQRFVGNQSMKRRSRPIVNRYNKERWIEAIIALVRKSTKSSLENLVKILTRPSVRYLTM